MTRRPKPKRRGFGDKAARYSAQAPAEAPRTARLFRNGRSQAVRLPKEFRFEGDEVYVRREGDRVVLTPKRKPKKNPWQNFFDALDSFDPRFPLVRDQPPVQVRKSIEEWAGPRRRPAKRRR